MPTKANYSLISTDVDAVAAPEDNKNNQMETNSSSESSSNSVGMPSTHSSQQLVPQDTENVPLENKAITNSLVDRNSLNSISSTEWFTVLVLCFVNLINYMDRFTIAGVLTDIQKDFIIDDDSAGLLQTAFVLSYMICAPIFGYLGDRYSRKWIMVLGVTLWGATTLMGSFMNSFGWFLTFRGLVGIGEASYSTIAPTILSDLFIGGVRSKMLAMFYFAIPVGSGLGYIVGSETAKALGSWRWALRVTPILALVAVVLIVLTKDPERGESEGSHNMEVTSYSDDIKDIARNPSFMLSTAGFTCVAFVAGALAWWGPLFIYQGIKLQPGNEHVELNEVSFKFGAITMLSGIIGVPLGSFLSTCLIKRFPKCDPIICAMGLLISAPLMGAAMYLVTINTALTFTLIFFAELALNLNWAIVADILLYVVVPTRRSTAEAFQILISHAFGDAGSPYFVGVLSVALRGYLGAKVAQSFNNTSVHTGDLEALSLTFENATTTMTTMLATAAAEATQSPFEIKTKFLSLQYALFSTCFVEVIGGVFFLITSFYVLRDKRNAELAIRGCELELSDSSTKSESSERNLFKLLLDSQQNEPSHHYAHAAGLETSEE